MRPFPRRRTLKEPSSRRLLQSQKRKFEGETAPGFPFKWELKPHAVTGKETTFKRGDAEVRESDKASAAAFSRTESSSTYQTSIASSVVRPSGPNDDPDNTAPPTTAKVGPTASTPSCRPRCALADGDASDLSNRDKPAHFGWKRANRRRPAEDAARRHLPSNACDGPLQISSRQRATFWGQMLAADHPAV